MTSSTLVHYGNQLLPEVEWEGIPRDEKDSIERIQNVLEKLENVIDTNEEISPVLFGKCSRLVKHHRTLKYYFSDELRLRIAKLYLALYELKDRVTVPLKTKLLNSGKYILRKHWKKIPITMDWRFHWSYLLSKLNREERYDATSAHNVLLEHLKAISVFMFSTRQYFNPYDTNEHYRDQGLHGSLLDYAMEKLTNLRVPTSVEGLLALVLCLPTDFQNYDDYLPQWFDIWGTLDHNSIWDCCWLIVMSRARKHSKTFDWHSVLPFLLTKARDVLSIPNVAGVANVNSNSFPKGFPTYYQIVLQQFKDINAKIISKLSKVIFKAVLSGKTTATAGQFSITPPNLIVENVKDLNLRVPGITDEPITVKASCIELCQFFQAIRPLLHPSNGNNHLMHIARFVEVLINSISKRIGENVAAKIVNVAVEPIDGTTWNTLQYLQSLLLVIALESVNAKNFVVQRVYVACLNQLISLNSSLTHLIVPFLIDALEPKSVTQPQRTLAALNTLSSCLRTMLYPNPVALQYLPDILRLSLPGVDASDPKKTVCTLELFTNIFAWIPIRSKLHLKKSTIGNYSDILQISDPIAQREKARILSDGDYDTQLERLSSYVTDEWLPAFFEKIFVVIDGLEQKVKGVKESPLISSISQAVGFIMQALIHDADNSLLYEIEDKILNYVLQSAPLNAFKVSGKLVEAIATNDASRLGSILERILDKEVINHVASADKLRFRLVLAGACFRTTKNTAIIEHLPIIQPIFQDRRFLHHDDLKVRKAFCKLFKDFFKGTTAFFPMDVMPTYNSTEIFGQPNIPTRGDVIWNVPTPDVLSKSLVVLREITNHAKDEIIGALSTAVNHSADSSEAPKLSYKKCEEFLSNNLLLFVKIVRGLADITGDVSANPDKDYPIMSTGREGIYKQLAPEDRNYLLHYRRDLLEFLNQIHDSLEKIKDHPIYRGLRDNDYIAKQWMKVLMFTLTRRTAALKDHDGVRKWLKFQKFQNASVLVRTVYKTLQSYQQDDLSIASSSANQFANINYWKFHDLNTTYVIFKLWLQHSIRASELSHAAVRVYVNSEDVNDPVIKCINNLMSLARHEYDSIRPQARKIFEKISSHLGGKIVKIIETTLQLLLLPNATYYQTASTLVTMKQHSVMKRLASNIELKTLFFNSLVSIQQSAANITDLDKREKVMLSLTDAMTKYAVSWNHSVHDLDVLYQTIFPSILSYFGNTGSTASLIDAENGGTDVTNVAAGGGLRLDTFLGYILLHLVSSTLSVGNTPSKEQRSNNLKGIWQLTIRFLSQGHGQPTQHIGEALFARLSEITYQAVIREKVETTSADWFGLTKDLLKPIDNKQTWQNFLLGLARCHPISGADENGGQNGAQWAAGIDSVLSAAEFLRIVKPRNFSSKGYEHNLCSIYFRKENVAAFYSLAKSGLIDITTDQSILNYLQLTKAIPTSSESEKRAVNCVLAEFFSGLLRAYYDQDQINPETEKLFLQYLLEILEPLSMDYSRDWEEGLFFALEVKAYSELGPIQRYFLEQFNQTLKASVGPSAVLTDEGIASTTNNHVLDEGFSKQGKILMFVIAILNADCVARVSTKENQLLVADQIVQIFLAGENNIIIPYRTSRMEIASIITTLTDHLAHNNTQTNHHTALVGLYEKLTAEAKGAATGGVASTADDTKMQVEDLESDPPIENLSAAIATTNVKNIGLKNTIDTILHIVPKLTQRVPIRYVANILLSLFPVLLQGVIHSEAEVSRNSTDSLLYIANALTGISDAFTSSQSDRLLTTWIQQLSEYYDQFTTSWKIKEVIIKLNVCFMINNWFLLQEKERKLFKDLFTKGLNDLQLNVRDVSSIGIIAYLTYKTPQEMKVIAESYTRNSETLASREKQKRKQAKSGESTELTTAKPDQQYITTIQMISCVILTMSYDLPDYIPNLIASFLRHAHYSDVLKSIITKAIQLFKRTHQDRWEEFQLKFNSDQLADLQGAGAAHYFS